MPNSNIPDITIFRQLSYRSVLNLENLFAATPYCGPDADPSPSASARRLRAPSKRRSANGTIASPLSRAAATSPPRRNPSRHRHRHSRPRLRRTRVASSPSAQAHSPAPIGGTAPPTKNEPAEICPAGGAGSQGSSARTKRAPPPPPRETRKERPRPCGRGRS